MASSALAPARSSSAISKSASTRLGLTIQHNAVVECVSKYATCIQMSLSPCFERAWDNIASQAPPGYGAVHLIVIQESLADDKKIVIALSPICVTCSASKKDDGARMQSLHEAVYRLRKSSILYRLLLHMSLYIGARARIQ